MKWNFLFFLTLIKSQENDFLHSANQHFKEGNFNDALLNYDKALEHDPNNHVTFYRRATAYLTIGKHDLAIRDFDSVLALKNDNHHARFKRASLLLHSGTLDGALSDLETLNSSAPEYMPDSVNELYNNAKHALDLYTTINKSSSKCDLISEMDTLLTLCPKFLSMLRIRADCHLAKQNDEVALFDYKRLLKLSVTPLNDVSLVIAQLHLKLGEVDLGIVAVKECLKNDLDNKECKKVFRELKSIQKGFTKIEGLKEKRMWSDGVEFVVNDGFLESVKSSSVLKTKVDFFLCSCYLGLKKWKEAVKSCSAGLDVSKNSEALADRAEAYIELEEYESAKRDYAAALETDQQNRRYNEGYRKVETLIKRAGMRDYYKILGVSRSATQREIKKAYRKLAQVYHPDKYNGDDLDKDGVLKKMSEINLAYEVLGNEETREKYDQGHDPNDPMNGQQQGHQHNPFQGFQFHGFPGGGFQGGGGQHFQFHF